MRTYSIPLPSPYAVVLQNGTPMVRDAEECMSAERNLILERYFNDLYALFLDKLTSFAVQATPKTEDRLRLRLLMDELLRTKEMLVRGGGEKI